MSDVMTVSEARAEEERTIWQGRAMAAEQKMSEQDRELAKLRSLLRPFANIPLPPSAKPHWPINYYAVSCTFADVIAARAALYPTGENNG
jgi:hypothetical protein